MAKRKIGGIRLKLKIAESNLSAKSDELDRVKRIHSEIVAERDFLRKIVTNLSETKRH